MKLNVCSAECVWFMMWSTHSLIHIPLCKYTCISVSCMCFLLTVSIIRFVSSLSKIVSEWGPFLLNVFSSLVETDRESQMCFLTWLRLG